VSICSSIDKSGFSGDSVEALDADKLIQVSKKGKVNFLAITL
jgi:hypothetical protein